MTGLARHDLPSMTRPTFLDHASTTPLDPAVTAAMLEVLQGPLGLGNPASATHPYGQDAAAAVERARAEVAALIGAKTTEVVFTSGATEADNLAILGIARGLADRGQHLVTVRTEHKAVLDPHRQLEKRGWRVTWLEPGRDGRVDPRVVADALRDDTQLVSVMHANNETGVVQDVAAIAAVCRARDVLLHCDAAQSAARLPVGVGTLGVDLLSLSAHKMYGPKGIGALWVSPRARPWLEPLMWGGGHERGLRPGTPATHQAVGFGVAAALVQRRREEDACHVERLASALREQLADIPGLFWNDHPRHRLPGLLSLSIEGVEGESLLTALPEIAVSSGAACDSAVGEPSYVLRAQGLSPELAQSTLRIAFGRHNLETDAALAAAALRRAVTLLRTRDGPGPESATGWYTGTAGSLREGARIRCFLRADAAGRVEGLEFRAATCPAVWAILEDLSRHARGRSVAAVTDGGPRDWASRARLPPEKLSRLFRVEDAILAAVLAWGGGVP